MATAADYERLGGWARVMNPDQKIDRRGATRQVPMRVLHLGFPRTGTMSMQQAYEILGFANPYHFNVLLDNFYDVDLWIEALRIKERGPDSARTPVQWRKRFDELLGHCSATTDAPTVCFWRELLIAYPEAKVVLVERDIDKWETSFLGVLDILHPAGNLLRCTDPGFFGRFFRLNKAWASALVGSSDRTQAARNLRSAYQDYYTQVRATVPTDRLLEYRLGTGWEPLCTFLEVDIPNQKFPHQNESGVLKEGIKEYFNRAIKNSLFNTAIAIGVVAALGGIVSRLRGRALL